MVHLFDKAAYSHILHHIYFTKNEFHFSIQIVSSRIDLKGDDLDDVPQGHFLAWHTTMKAQLLQKSVVSSDAQADLGLLYLKNTPKSAHEVLEWSVEKLMGGWQALN